MKQLIDLNGANITCEASIWFEEPKNGGPAIELTVIPRAKYEHLKKRIVELENELFTKGDEASFKQADWK